VLIRPAFGPMKAIDPNRGPYYARAFSGINGSIAMDDNRHLRRLIADIATRTDAQTRELARALASRCWPVRTADRAEPTAAQWLRRWTPKPIPLTRPVCSCGQGHCPVCN
jgi:hypothetical protein